MDFKSSDSKQEDIGQTSIKGGEFELAVCVDDKQKEVYLLNEVPNIIADVGKEYQVKFFNHSAEEVIVALSVDGVESGLSMIVKPFSDCDFDGFQRSGGIAAFTFAALKQVPSTSQSNKYAYSDINIGLITATVWSCKRGALKEKYSYHQNSHVEKNLSGLNVDKKKCAIATGAGTLLANHTSLSKYTYEWGQILHKMEIRYNGIAVPVPKAEVEEEFMNGVNYE